MDQTFQQEYTCSTCHKLPAYEICLDTGAMSQRLVCNPCKKYLTKDQLMSLYSLNDFISGELVKRLEQRIKRVKVSSVVKTQEEPDAQIEKFIT